MRNLDIQQLVQLVLIRVFSSTEIHVQHRIFRPFGFQTFHCQTFEQMLLALEIGFESRNQQTLPKSSRTA